jgi:hypothetical protein
MENEPTIFLQMNFLFDLPQEQVPLPSSFVGFLVSSSGWGLARVHFG